MHPAEVDLVLVDVPAQGRVAAAAAAAAVAGIGRHALPDFLLVRHLAHVTGTSLVGDEDGGHHEL